MLYDITGYSQRCSTHMQRRTPRSGTNRRALGTDAVATATQSNGARAAEDGTSLPPSLILRRLSRRSQVPVHCRPASATRRARRDSHQCAGYPHPQISRIDGADRAIRGRFVLQLSSWPPTELGQRLRKGRQCEGCLLVVRAELVQACARAEPIDWPADGTSLRGSLKEVPPEPPPPLNERRTPSVRPTR